MKIIIRKIDNGYIITDCSDVGEDKRPIVYCVEELEEEDTMTGNPRAVYNLLWKLIELFGESGSKYDKERVRVNIEHGEDYLCEDKECDICRDNPCHCWGKKCDGE